MPNAGTRTRRLPQRTCVSCATTTNKRELIRVVRTPEGRVVADPTGKEAGRGAYICGAAECWDQAVRKGRLARSLKVKLSNEDAEGLRQFASGLTGKSE